MEKRPLGTIKWGVWEGVAATLVCCADVGADDSNLDLAWPIGATEMGEKEKDFGLTWYAWMARRVRVGHVSARIRTVPITPKIRTQIPPLYLFYFIYYICIGF